MFKGTYRHRIDPKGRLPVPAAFRRALGADRPRVVLTRIDDCLAAYPPTGWERLEEQLSAMPAFSPAVKALTRRLLAYAADCPVDTQGRILLPPSLRAGVGLEREAVVVGVLGRFEIWAPESWDAFLRDSERLLDDAALAGWPVASLAPTKPALAVELPQSKPKR